mmetsp:Transcript_36914/g.89640  ORF Transcript_36914/g.89640 Transcript_36914/m.89640 type:complete len:488 (+) Transcript_36914:178-1641(+)
MKGKVFWVLFVLVQAGYLLDFERNAGKFLGRKDSSPETVSNARTPNRDLPTIFSDDNTVLPHRASSAGAGSLRTRSQESSIPPRVVVLPETFLSDFDSSDNYNHRRIEEEPDTEDLALTSQDADASPLSNPIYDFERDWFDNCEPDIRHPIHPTCNSVHELDASSDFIDMVLSMEGNWRAVLRIDDQAILKVLHLHREFDDESYQKHEMDNAVMEHLAGSPYIVSSFGFCGQSVITPFARKAGKVVAKDKTLRKIERLKLARNLARGLAELHAMQRIDFDSSVLQNRKNDPSNSTQRMSTPMFFAHHDINIANTISIQEKSIQWNDFNLGIYSKHSRENEAKACDVPIRYSGELWRSPEEIRNSTNGVLATVQPCDVYSLGNILYHILAKHQPWTHLEDPPEPELAHVAQQKVEGKLPNLPEKYIPKYMELKVLWKATKACFRLDPATRPTALQLAEALQTACEWSQDDRIKSKIKDDDIDKLFAIP